MLGRLDLRSPNAVLAPSGGSGIGGSSVQMTPQQVLPQQLTMGGDQTQSVVPQIPPDATAFGVNAAPPAHPHQPAGTQSQQATTLGTRIHPGSYEVAPTLAGMPLPAAAQLPPPPQQHQPSSPPPPQQTSPQQPLEQESGFCGGCGAPMKPDVRFCNKCGHKRN